MCLIYAEMCLIWAEMCLICAELCLIWAEMCLKCAKMCLIWALTCAFANHALIRVSRCKSEHCIHCKQIKQNKLFTLPRIVFTRSASELLVSYPHRSIRLASPAECQRFISKQIHQSQNTLNEHSQIPKTLFKVSAYLPSQFEDSHSR
jgi:hypothetical protein